MMTLMRTIVELPNELIEGLAFIGALEKKSRAALIRDAVQMYLEYKQPKDMSNAFGLWASQKIDALAYEDEIRAEWDKA